MIDKPFVMLSVLLMTTILSSSEFSFRKYQHVKDFYKDIHDDVIEVALKYKIPPAAIMAIAGLESGYGSGYVCQITGNILSLGAFKGDKELPSLYLPYSKSQKRVLFDPDDIKVCPENDLVYKQRAKSLKRDYRPLKYAGKKQKLELLLNNDTLREKAFKACLNDFATRWIVSSSNIEVFRNARLWLDEIIAKRGIKALFDKKVNAEFISMIGGQPHSFNYRDTWPKKAKLIMDKVGLVKLSNDIYIKKSSFNKAWSNQ